MVLGRHREREEGCRWELLTDLPVGDMAAAVEELDWCALRWRHEASHKVLKSGCRAEQSKLRTTARLTNLLAVLCVIGWLTMLGRVSPDAPAGVAFAAGEIDALDRLAGGAPPAAERTVAHYLAGVAKLGGHLGREGDPPPGNMVVWRGVARLADICLGLELASRVVGH